ncbi:DUF362 domain-containing protein [Chloroflexota bacterium]
MNSITLLGGLKLIPSFMLSSLRGTEPIREPTFPAIATDSTLSAIEETPITKISLVCTRDRRGGVPRAIALLGTNPVRGKVVAIKPNFNSADPAPGSTHNDTLRALVLTLREMGANKITLAERSGPGDTTRQVMERKGIFDLAEELGFVIVNLEELGPEGWVHLHPENSHWTDGFHFPRVYVDAESIIQTCCLKTHAYGGHYTLSLKNAVGMVPRAGYPYMGELHRSPYQRQMIAEINTAYSPDLVLLDGVEAFVDGGPARGTRVEAGVILAGSDRVAIDAVGVAVLRSLGTTPEVSRGLVFEQEQIVRAVELGLGVKSPAQIEIVTDDAESEAFAGRVKDILLGG